jgi:23S rRNA (guanine745-N1)-methyltransferase
MLADVVEFLACAHCGEALTMGPGSLRCERGHSFDISRQGYASLLTHGVSRSAGDSAAMVSARAAFLRSGHYAPIADALADAAVGALGKRHGCIVDVGSGTGYYLARVLDSVTGLMGVAADVSRYALRRAARAHPRLGAVACDVWRRLPVRTSAAVLVLNVFAPRNAAEMSRILQPGGFLVVVTPTSRHHAELVGPLGLVQVDRDKEQRLAETLGTYFSPTEQRGHEFPLSLGRRDIANLVAMGPSAWHTRADLIDERTLALPDPMAATASVRLSVYERR